MADDGAKAKKDPIENASPDDENADFAIKFWQFVDVDGDMFPRLPTVKMSVADHIRSLKTMPMREDDIIIAATPKCGTHWLWEAVQMLVRGKAEHDPMPKENVMLEINPVETFKSLPSPRILNTHLFPRLLSNEVLTKRSRVIHVRRNPKDVAVSLYFHVMQLVATTEDTGILEFLKGFLAGGAKAGSYLDYFGYMKEMTQWQREHPEVPVINLYYEDMKKDLVQCLRQVADFLKVEASDQLLQDIADQCSFKKLKHADEHVKVTDNSPHIPLFKGGVQRLYRKGEVGDWKNYFTVALSEEYDRLVPEKLKGCDLNFQYTI